MFRVPCPECTARLAAALDESRVLATPAGVLSDFCEHEHVVFTVGADRGVVVDWTVQPCESLDRFRTLIADARAAHQRQVQDIAENGMPGGPPAAATRH